MRHISACIALLGSLLIASSAYAQSPEWKGKIEYEDRVKFVINPKEPLYGDIKFNLEEDLIIEERVGRKYRFYQISRIAVGREGNIYALDIRKNQVFRFDRTGEYIDKFGGKGQGPGEFERPAYILIDNRQNIFVSENRKIQIFNNQGKYLDRISFNNDITQFICDDGGNIIAISHVVTEEGTKKAIMKFDDKGRMIKELAVFTDIKAVVRKGDDGKPFSLKVYHEYNYWPYLCPSGNSRFYYAHPSEYKLYMMSNEGALEMVIEKNGSPKQIGRKEKELIVDRIEGRLKRMGRTFSRDYIEAACQFPEHRPFFNSITSDKRGFLFIARTKSVIDENESYDFDIFGENGIFLYRTSLRFEPDYIDKGNLYRIYVDDDPAEVKLIKYKIKNWDQIKNCIN